MNKKFFNSSIIHLFLALLIIASIQSCNSSDDKSYAIITEVYEVDKGASKDFSKGKLKYMEYENFVDNRMVNKTFYNEDQSIKGKEVYNFVNDSKYPTSSKFYDAEGKILSNYRFGYQDSLKVQSEGFEGDSDILLRVESYHYDTKGNMVRKTIFNEFNQREKSFLFAHDASGNEIKMNVVDRDGNQLLSETYEIVTVDEKGRWVEKFGYLNDEKLPITFYNRKRGNK